MSKETSESGLVCGKQSCHAEGLQMSKKSREGAEEGGQGPSRHVDATRLAGGDTTTG